MVETSDVSLADYQQLMTTTAEKAAASVPEAADPKGNTTLTHNMSCASEAKSGH